MTTGSLNSNTSKRSSSRKSGATKSGMRSGTGYSSSKVSTSNRIVIGLAEGRGGNPEIGMVIIDLNSAECIMHQYNDYLSYTRTIQKLVLYQPIEIIIPKTMIHPSPSKLVIAVQNYLPQLNLIATERRIFNEDIGRKYINQLTIDEHELDPALFDKYFVMSTVGAIFQYLDLQYGIQFQTNSLNFQFQPIEGTVSIGMDTARYLELVSNLRKQSDHKGCLYGVLNATKTRMGARRLRSNILQPLTDVEKIKERQEAVKELCQDTIRIERLIEAFKSLPDVDRLVTSVVILPRQSTLDSTSHILHDFLELKQLLENVSKVAEALDDCRSGILTRIKDSLKAIQLREILELIKKFISDDLEPQKNGKFMHSQHLHAIKFGFNGLLDVARRTYDEVTQDIHKLVQDYNEQFNLSCKLKFSAQHSRYHLYTTDKNIDENRLPSIFANAIRRKNILEFSSIDLMKLNERLLESINEIFALSYEVAQSVMAEVRRCLTPLYRVSDTLGTLDLLLCFSMFAKSLNSFCFPEFGDSIAICNGINPVKSKFMDGTFVANDCFSFDGGNFQVITGPNMSGKTTYLKQIALLCIIGQMGAPIPADHACLKIFGSIFARLGQEDEPESNLSSFMVEMRDMVFILNHVDDHSLIIVDELARGTSVQDGLGISFAICEDLIQTKATVFFVTHYYELAQLLELFPNVVNLHLETSAFTVEPGFSTDDQYGIDLAEKIRFPRSIIDNSRVISTYCHNKQRNIRQIIKRKKNSKSHIAVKLVGHLRHLKASGDIDMDDLIKFIKDLKQQLDNV